MNQSSLTTILHSLNFDRQFLFSPFPKTLSDRLEFIVRKYSLLLNHHYLGRPVRLGDSKVRINGRFFYYESTLGIAPYQTMLVNFENRYLPYLQNLHKPLVIDIGAHIGFFSLTAAKLCKPSRIFACEPLRLTFSLLKKNCTGEKAIIPIHLGFWNKPTRHKMFYTESFLAYSSLFPERFTWNNHPMTQTVKVTTLDAFAKRNHIDRIDLLKIDAEGAEEQILKGASQTLTKTIYLLIECSFDQLGGSTMSSLVKHLHGKEKNFQLIEIGDIRRTPQRELATIDFFFKNLRFKGARQKQYPLPASIG
ncbi:MAG: hypothetical protein A2900_05880 [Candidatus Chisholmbacteria bacterium RIFCSPLOWO2_01_FULL_50_28]|uniref:Methyltransferase FkbM domain-containing protein n=1 Tax=Candidatus Chisholmbacteria bacterium RIFCSPHIGHO2_01_FULL_52_32 TaxID=1797591 RepID=A0A1G1VQK7_9BACT|nr:MAG: hypothetical protein A2786_05655 [Candidatus Chisholmbacteria bacterium RIFCSPHIGHO2_01_FULL_52_32]OGY20566.1 MAG: hypothetical protein A2900_05880 [Candidatus Chisholmbacteria bacterium RIFCSPLOWO2_01_FULL_50_28]